MWHSVGVSPKPNSVPGSRGPAGVEPVFDEDYITMDPLYVEPPVEDDTENSDTLKADASKYRRSGS